VRKLDLFVEEGLLRGWGSELPDKRGMKSVKERGQIEGNYAYTRQAFIETD
jgi:hypothetical protein